MLSLFVSWALPHSLFRLFSENPELFPVFPFSNVSLSEVWSSPVVRKHGSLVLGMVNYSIKELDNMDKLMVELTALGKRHLNYEATALHFPVYITMSCLRK